jgi:hypothetical protein
LSFFQNLVTFELPFRGLCSQILLISFTITPYYRRAPYLSYESLPTWPALALFSGGAGSDCLLNFGQAAEECLKTLQELQMEGIQSYSTRHPFPVFCKQIKLFDQVLRRIHLNTN